MNLGRDFGRFHSRICCRPRRFWLSKAAFSTCILSIQSMQCSCWSRILQRRMDEGNRTEKKKRKEKNKSGIIWNEGRFFREVQPKAKSASAPVPPGSAAKKAKNALVHARPVRRTHNRDRLVGKGSLIEPISVHFPHRNSKRTNSRYRR